MKTLTSFFAMTGRLSLVFLFGPLLHAGDYEDLRSKWVSNITGGNFTVDSALTTKVAALDTSVAQLRADMVPGVPAATGYLFPEANQVSASLGTNQAHAHLTKTFESLAKMAIALRTKGSAYEFTGSGSSLAIATRDDVLRGLGWMIANAYQDNTLGVWSTAPLAKWWELEIGSTGWLGTILCCLSTGPFEGGANGGLDQTEIDTYSRPMIFKLRNPSVLNGSGANGAWRARTWTYLGMLRKDRDENGNTKNYLREAQIRLDGFLASPPPDVYSWDSEGFHPDGTFLGHRILSYAGSYGAQMIDRLAELAEFYNGTTWSTSTLKTSFVNWVAACEAQSFNLQFFQNVQGRSLSRYRQQNTTAVGLCLTTIWVAQIVSGQERSDLHAMIRTWLDDTGINLLANPESMTIPQYLRVRAFYQNDLPGAGTLAAADEFRVFPYGGTAVVRRQNWAASVNSFTNNHVGNTRPRLKSNENDNGETPRGGFLGNGSLQVLTRDLDAFANGYYENLEWKRIAGTTVDIDLEPIWARAINSTNWSGGASTGRIGVYGFQLQPWDAVDAETNVQSADIIGRFHARKGWFFFDKEIVALGSDIRRTSTSVDHKIHTNIENRKLLPNNSNSFKLGLTGSSQMIAGPTALSTSSFVQANTNRAWISGNTASTSMGYFFPGGVSLNYTRTQRTTSVPSPAPTVFNPVANYLMMWVSHGIPSSGAYQYVLLPGFNETDTNTYAASAPISVLANSSSAQVVRKVMPAPANIEKDETLDATGALFFNDNNTPVTLNGVTHVRSSRQGALMVEETEAKIKITLSDVTWQQTGLTTVEVGKKVSGWQSRSSGANVVSTYPSIVLEVNTSGAKGAGLEFVFHKRHEFGADDDGLFIEASSSDPGIKYLSNQPGADGDRIFSYNADALKSARRGW